MDGSFEGPSTWLYYLSNAWRYLWRCISLVNVFTTLKATEDQGKVRCILYRPVIKNYFANFLSEIIGTAILCLGILFIGVNKIADGMNPLIVGGLIVAID